MSENDLSNLSDRELMGLAAKAAGHKIVQWVEKNGWWSARLEWPHGSGIGFWPWNPLKDAQDAFGLAVELCIDVSHFEDHVAATKMMGIDRLADMPIAIEKVGDNRYVATFRAIVCCAAKVGRIKNDSENESD